MNKKTRDTVIIVVISLSVLLNLFIGGRFLWQSKRAEIRAQMAEQLLATIITTVRSQGEISINLGTQSVILVEKVQPFSDIGAKVFTDEVKDANE